MVKNEAKRVVIVGGGTAGITVAAQLRRKAPELAISLIEPSEQHFYQPLWTLVGGGVFRKEDSARPTADFIPQGVEWLRDRVAGFDPSANRVTLAGGGTLDYAALVVAPGIQINWSAVPGLKDGLGKDGVCSNYSYAHAEYTWECIRSFKGGTALFTVPNTPVKCGGAPQKIMYLACDYWRKNGVLEKTKVVFSSPQPKIFPVPKYAATLEAVLQSYGVDARFNSQLVELRTDSRDAVLENLETKEQTAVAFDMVHVTPPMGPPDFVKSSPLANQAGWCDVDKYTLQHVRFPNVFSLGDASSLPTSKTGAAVRKQAPVLVANLVGCLRGEPLAAKYDGYTSCPIVTAYGKMMLAEFDYDQKPKESFPFDQAKERWTMWLLKLYGLPLLYWRGMLRGRL